MADQPDQLAKLLAAIRERPRNVRFEELLKVMDLAGFESRFTKSKHGVLFWHRIYPVSAHAAHPHDGPVLASYVRTCLNAIEEVRQLEEDSNA